MPTSNAVNISSQGTVYYNGTGTFSGIDGGASTQVLTSNGTGIAPSFQAAASGSSFIFNLSLDFAGSNPVDSTTYYLMKGSTIITNTASTATGARIYFTKATTITKVYGFYNILGTLGSSENCTLFIRKNDTSNTNITTTLQLTAVEGTYNNTGLSISFVAGDYMTVGFTGPAWATNPTLVNLVMAIST
jgi:hypothetical protein